MFGKRGKLSGTPWHYESIVPKIINDYKLQDTEKICKYMDSDCICQLKGSDYFLSRCRIYKLCKFRKPGVYFKKATITENRQNKTDDINVTGKRALNDYCKTTIIDNRASKKACPKRKVVVEKGDYVTLYSFKEDDIIEFVIGSRDFARLGKQCIGLMQGNRFTHEGIQYEVQYIKKNM